MQIQTEALSNTLMVLHPIGRMDVESSPQVRQAILDVAQRGILGVVVNLGQVEFMDSSGLSALVSGMKVLRSFGGMLSLCNANAQIRTSLRLTMLDKVFPVHESVEQALAALV